MRIKLIDGLRGIAALAVVLHHVIEAIIHKIDPSLHHLSAFTKYGALGVDMFFILSGFVIAMTLDRGPVTWRSSLFFIARRSVRLDPPYFLTIGIIVGITYLAIILGAGVQAPTAPQLIAHAFYLQNVLGYRDLNPVNWTLCLEVQFYLVFVALLLIGWRFLLVYRIPPFIRWILFATVLITLAVFSALSAGDYIRPPVNGLFIDRWYQFFLGVVVYWCRRNYLPSYMTAIYVLVVFSISFIGKQNPGDIVAAIVAFVLQFASSSRALDASPLQFLGRISYSLYLTHIPFVYGAIAALSGIVSVGSAAALVLVGVGATLLSIVAAYFFYRIVEAPSVRLSKRIGAAR